MGVSGSPEGHTFHPFLGCSTLSTVAHNSVTCQEPAQGTGLWDFLNAPNLEFSASKRRIWPLIWAS